MNGVMSIEVSVIVSDPKCPEPADLLREVAEAMKKIEEKYPDVVSFSLFSFVNTKTHLEVKGSTPVTTV